MTTASAGQSPTFDAGQRLDGFVVRRVTDLPNLRATAYELTHEKTGARILHLHAPQDAENLFCVTIPTPPPDDTGLPHILEHCVLGGSKKYPVKDPFFEMVKSSMATFINAMTADDFTVYPVASNVRQDFYNLAEVYWDAVFYPTLTEQTFRREAHHLEFANKGDTSSDLRIQGIVYNEMKGGMSGPDARLGELVDRHLFPDTPIGFNAGGEPDHIPDLRYEDFIRFHRTLYHPSNAYIFLYGDIPTREHLEFLGPKLDAFSPQQPSSPTPTQPRFTAPRSVRATYPLAPGQPTAERSFVLLAWIVGDASDVMDVLALAALERVLLGNQGAPLRKALIDSKLGADLTHSHLGVWTRDVSFSVGLKGTEADRAEAIQDVIFQTLKRLAEEGVPRENVEAAFQQLAYSHREINPQYPLGLLWRAQLAWLRAGDPIVGLRSDRLLEELRSRYERDPRLFSRLIRERLLDNPHRVTITLVPDAQMQAQQEAAFAEKLRALKASMSPEQLAEVARQEAELEQILSTPNSPEALATLPQLKVADLPRKPRHIPTTIESIGPIDVLRNDVFANGVNYLHVSFDLAALPEALWPYVPLYADCVSKMGAAGRDYAATAARIASNTGGVGFGSDATGRVDDPGASARFGTLTTKFLDERADEALRLIEDLVFSLDLSTHDRLREILLQERAYHRTRPAQAGMSIAMWRAARRFGPTRRLADEMYGVPMTRRIEQLASEDGLDELTARLREVQAILLASSKPTISFTGSPAVYDALVRRLEEWSRRLFSAPLSPAALSEAPADGPRREGFSAPMDAAYCVTTLPAPHLTDPAAALVMVGNRVVSSNYVLEEVRFRGTAYGGGSSYSGHNRILSFHSYRDPHVIRTLDVFRKAIDWIRGADWTKADVDRAIITAAKEGERPIRPGEATGLALMRRLLGDTPERREARHAALLGATPAAARQTMIDLIERGMPHASSCVVSSREKLEGANRERPGEAMPIEDILPA